MSSSLATVQAREKGIVGGKDPGRFRNKLQWDGDSLAVIDVVLGTKRE